MEDVLGRDAGPDKSSRDREQRLVGWVKRPLRNKYILNLIVTECIISRYV